MAQTFGSFLEIAGNVVLSVLHGGKGIFTRYCVRLNPRMIANLASEPNEVSRADLIPLGLKDAVQPKRAFILCFITMMAAADFLKKSRESSEIYQPLSSKNPISYMDEDTLTIEASFFFWFNFSRFIVHATREGTLTEADQDALMTAGKILCSMIEMWTRRSASNIFASRLREYEESEQFENPVETFVRILLRSIGKRSFDEQDQPLPLDLAATAVSSSAMIYMTAILPEHLNLYKHIVQNYPMD
jgi:hypothetical protein